jgi:hypothetical protein
MEPETEHGHKVWMGRAEADLYPLMFQPLTLVPDHGSPEWETQGHCVIRCPSHCPLCLVLIVGSLDIIPHCFSLHPYKKEEVFASQFSSGVFEGVGYLPNIWELSLTQGK